MFNIFKRNGKFEIVKNSAGEFYFRLKSSNGQVILLSESYKTLQGCQKGINSVRENSKFEQNFDIKISKNNQRYFVLKAVNGEIIGTSEMYQSITSTINGIQSVQSVAPSANENDLTS
jgi:uncharacterized protein YegP (UPF0339 family)